MIKFTKMHGIGNDYVYINDQQENFLQRYDAAEFARFVSDRRKGIGSDGVIVIAKSDKADFAMRMFNADGSEGKMCGNGTRCIGKYVFDNKLTDKTSVSLLTLSGIKHLKLDVKNGTVQTVTVDMGKAILDGAEIPTTFSGEVINHMLRIKSTDYYITAVSMGNPHCVVFYGDPNELDLTAIGPHFEHDEHFPEGVNTEFVQVNSKTELTMRVWERGSGETMACGTGACATVVAAVLNGHCEYDSEVTVHLRGGDLYIVYKSDGTVLMRGGATTVFTGEIEF